MGARSHGRIGGGTRGPLPKRRRIRLPIGLPPAWAAMRGHGGQASGKDRRGSHRACTSPRCGGFSPRRPSACGHSGNVLSRRVSRGAITSRKQRLPCKLPLVGRTLQRRPLPVRVAMQDLPVRHRAVRFLSGQGPAAGRGDSRALVRLLRERVPDASRDERSVLHGHRH